MKNILPLSLAIVTSMLSLHAQEPAGGAKTPAEGSLTQFLDRNSKDVARQVARLTQEVFLLKTELNVLTFRSEYGDRVKLQRAWFPATTSDHEAIPAYIFTPVGLAAGKKLPAIVM